jgi:drug/metabolite transporter (DMT)-like permease
MLRALVPVLFVFLWSTGFVVARAAAPHADLQFFLLWRFIAVALLLGVAALIARVRWPTPRDAILHVVTGALMMGVYLTFGYWAIARGLPAGIMALLGALQPLFTALLVLLLHRRQPAPRTWIGLLVGLCGVALVLAPKLAAHADAPLGGLAVAAGILSVAAVTFGTLAQRRLSHCDLRAALSLQNVGAALVALATTLGVGHFQWDGTLVVWLSLAWGVFGASIVAAMLLTWMMRHGEATHVTALMLLVPPLAALLAFALFHETLTPLQFIGFALALGGVLLARSVNRISP